MNSHSDRFGMGVVAAKMGVFHSIEWPCYGQSSVGPKYRNLARVDGLVGSADVKSEMFYRNGEATASDIICFPSLSNPQATTMAFTFRRINFVLVFVAIVSMRCADGIG